MPVGAHRRWLVVGLFTTFLYALVPFARQLVDWLRSGGLMMPFLLVAFGVAGAVAVGAYARHITARPLWAHAAVAVALMATAGWAVSLEVAEERVHLAQYGLLAVLVGWALAPRLAGARHGLGTFVIAAVLGAGDEALQAVVPSRVFDWRDVGFNVGAAALGSLVAAAAQARRPTSAQSDTMPAARAG